MNIKKLLGILGQLTRKQNRLNKDIEKILSGSKGTDEQKINFLEEHLIKNLNKKELSDDFRFDIERCLRVVLLHRGYYTDVAGELCKELILFFIGPVPKNLIAEKAQTWVKALGREFERGIYKDIIDRIDADKSIPNIIASLQHLFKTHLEKDKYQKQPFKHFLEYCLHIVNKYVIIKNSQQHSIWASAALECLDYLRAIISKYDKTLRDGTNEAAQKQLQRQKTRAEYFIYKSRMQKEPLAEYVNYQLQLILSPYNKASASDAQQADMLRIALWQQAISHSATFKSQEISSAERKKNVIAALGLMTGHEKLQRKENSNIEKIINALRKEKYSWWSYLKKMHELLTFKAKDAELLKALVEMKTLIIEPCYQEFVGKFWLKLAVCFYEAKRFELVKDCVQQARRFPIQNIAKIVEHIFAVISPDPSNVKSLDKGLILPKNNPNDVINLVNPVYPKEQQVLLIRLFVDEANFRYKDHFVQLLEHGYPYGLMEIIRILKAKDQSPQYQRACEAVTECYQKECLSPLVLCEKLNAVTFNKMKLLWGELYLNRAYHEEKVQRWKQLGLADFHIDYKLYTTVYGEVVRFLDNDDLLIPGADDFLREVNEKLYIIMQDIYSNIKSQGECQDFIFTDGRPGFLFVVLAELAGRFEDNYPLAGLMAKRSIAEIISADNGDQSINVSPKGSIEDDVFIEIENLVNKSPLKSEASDASSRDSMHTEDEEQFVWVGEYVEDAEESESVDVQIESPTYLGYFYLALSIWHTKIAGKVTPDKSSIKEFKENLLKAQESPVKSEKYYVMALRWFYYLNTKQNKLWVTDKELKQMRKELSAFRSNKFLDLRSRNDEQYLLNKFILFYKVKPYLELVMQDKIHPNPLAIMIYITDICKEAGDFFEDASDKKAFFEKVLNHLEFALDQKYIPALYLYAQFIQNSAREFVEDESALTVIEHVQECLSEAERYVAIDPINLKVLNENLSEIKTKREENPIEKFKLLPECKFNLLPFTLKYQSGTLKIDYQWVAEENSYCFILREEEGSIEFFYIRGFFTKAQELYVNDRNVQFADQQPPLVTIEAEKTLIVKHLEIAVMGVALTIAAYYELMCSKSEHDAHFIIDLANMAKFLEELIANKKFNHTWNRAKQRIDYVLQDVRSVAETDSTTNLRRSTRSGSLRLNRASSFNKLALLPKKGEGRVRTGSCSGEYREKANSNNARSASLTDLNQFKH